MLRTLQEQPRFGIALCGCQISCFRLKTKVNRLVKIILKGIGKCRREHKLQQPAGYSIFFRKGFMTKPMPQKVPVDITLQFVHPLRPVDPLHGPFDQIIDPLRHRTLKPDRLLTLQGIQEIIGQGAA